jgi:2-phospho-L-lactate guanylyltransferase
MSMYPPAPRWVVVVPVKPAADGKTRLAGALSDAARVRLVRAMAIDTITAAAATGAVERVVVVTSDTELSALLRTAVELLEDPGGGLDAAVLAGARRARELDPEAGVAVLLGDLPALRPADLADALDRATVHERSVVADAAGTGTTMLTAMPGADLQPHFGAGSAAAHERAGHVRLAVPADSTLRRDVDVADDLAAVEQLGVGSATRVVLGW